MELIQTRVSIFVLVLVEVKALLEDNNREKRGRVIQFIFYLLGKATFVRIEKFLLIPRWRESLQARVGEEN